MKITAEIVNGRCPTCNQLSVLVGLSKEFYRCLTCGADLHQHINGKISYLPVLTFDPSEGSPIVKQWDEEK